MYTFLIVVHIFVCFVLIASILLQAGRGGGMSDTFGGQQQSIFGTQTNAFMVRATELCACIFIVTSLWLGIISTQRGKSLLEKHRLMDVLKKNVVPASKTTGSNNETAHVTDTAKTLPVSQASAPAPVAPAAAPAAPQPVSQTKAPTTAGANAK